MKSIYRSVEGERAVRERYLKFLQTLARAQSAGTRPDARGRDLRRCVRRREGAPPLLLLHGGMRKFRDVDGRRRRLG